MSEVTVRQALEAVEEGADIYSYLLALKLREIERDRPGFVKIGKPMCAPVDGARTQPYFGCILTDGGREHLRTLEELEALS